MCTIKVQEVEPVQKRKSGRAYCVVANMLNCNIVASEFKLQSCYHVHFQASTFEKSYELSYFNTAPNDWLMSRLLFYKNDFGIK